jgi:adenylate kinase family enzyme
VNKIYIIGLAGSGKTYLANKLKDKFGYPIYTTDWVLYYEDDSHKKIKLSKEEYLLKIDEILSQDKWVVEGVHYFDKISDEADLILFVDVPLHKNILRMIKRYSTDSDYRKIYSFKSLISLIWKTIVGYYSRPEEDLLYYPKYKNRKKYKKVLEKYKDKVKVIRNTKKYLKTL